MFLKWGNLKFTFNVELSALKHSKNATETAKNISSVYGQNIITVR